MLLALDRTISHPITLPIEHGHFAEVSSESEALRLGSPGGSLTPMYTVPMDSAFTDPELRDWLNWADDESKVPAFVRTVAKAALIACSPDYELLRPVLVELKRRYPEAAARVQEPGRDFTKFLNEEGWGALVRKLNLLPTDSMAEVIQKVSARHAEQG